MLHTGKNTYPLKQANNFYWTANRDNDVKKAWSYHQQAHLYHTSDSLVIGGVVCFDILHKQVSVAIWLQRDAIQQAEDARALMYTKHARFTQCKG